MNIGGCFLYLCMWVQFLVLTFRGTRCPFFQCFLFLLLFASLLIVLVSLTAPEERRWRDARLNGSLVYVSCAFHATLSRAVSYSASLVFIAMGFYLFISLSVVSRLTILIRSIDLTSRQVCNLLRTPVVGTVCI